MGEDVHLDQIAKETDGFSGSDLKRMLASVKSSYIWWCGVLTRGSQIYVSARHFQRSRILSTFLGVIYRLHLQPLRLLDLNNDHERRLYLAPVVDLGIKFWSWLLEKAAAAVEVEVEAAEAEAEVGKS